MQEILKKIRKADIDFNLIEKNDKIIVGLSHGKDSMLLLKALSLYSRFEGKKFELIGVNLNLGFDDLDDNTKIIDYCNINGIEYKQYETSIYYILKHYLKKDGKIDCSRCSKLKRGAIVEIADSLGFNKIAFAHHGDDAVETLFMNMINGGRIATFLPKIDYEDHDLCFIRPLIYASEEEIIRAVKRNNIPYEKSFCPNNGNTKRAEVKSLLSMIYNNNPTAHQNFINMLGNEKQIKLWPEKDVDK